MGTNPAPIEVIITAQAQGLQNGLNQATAGVTKATSQIQNDFRRMAAIPPLRWSQPIQQETQKMAFSMHEAKGAMALMGEEIGVKIPRHIRGFLAELPGVGAAMSAAFSGFAIIGLIEVVVEAGRKVYEFTKSLSELSKEEKQRYDDVLKNSKEELEFKTKILRAEYELQIAKATGIDKDRLRVEEATALVKLNKDYVGELEKEKKHLQDIVDEQMKASDAALKPDSISPFGGGAVLATNMATQSTKMAEAAEEKVKELKRVIEEAEAEVTSALAREVNARTALRTAEAKAEVPATAPDNSYLTRTLYRFQEVRDRAKTLWNDLQESNAVEGKKAWDALTNPPVNLAVFTAKLQPVVLAQKNFFKEIKAGLDLFGQSISRGFSATLQGMMQGTQTFSQGMANMFRNIALSFAESLMKMLGQWIEHLILKSALKEAFEEKDAKKSAFRDAKDAARGGFKAGMHLPFPLNVVMAPVLAAAGFAGVMASASGGWERVPSDQLAMIHKDEQVLPAGYAEGLRNLVANGGSDTHVHLHGQVIDGKFWKQHQGEIVSTIRDAVGNRRFA
jgi:hypothetical protein